MLVRAGPWGCRFWIVCCKLWVIGDPDLLDPGLVAADLTDLALVTLLQLDIRSELAVNTIVKMSGEKTLRYLNINPVATFLDDRQAPRIHSHCCQCGS